MDLGEGILKEVYYYPFNFKNNKAKKTAKKEVLSVFKSIGLKEDFWNKDFRNLSTGQRQRIGLTLCYSLDKEVVLLDEPTSALDDESKKKVFNLLADRQKLIISTTHDAWWIEQCSKIVEI